MKVDTSARFANMSILSAFMVVMIHILNRNIAADSIVRYFRFVTHDGVCRIAVPFFFLAAGYFVARHLNDDGYWKNEVIKRIKTLVLPFASWCAIAFCLCSILIIIGNYMSGITWDSGLLTFSRLIRSAGLNPFAVPELRQLWFIRVLFIFMLILPIFKLYLSKWGGVILIFTSYIFIKQYSDSIVGDHVWRLLNYGVFSFEGAAFFALGIFLYSNKLEGIFANRGAGMASLIVGLTILLLRIKAGALAGLLFALSLPLMLYGCLTIIPNKSLNFLRGYSFPIYIIHLNVVFVYFFFLDRMCPVQLLQYLDPGASLLGVAICFTSVLAASIGIANMIKRISVVRPIIANVLFGGR